MGTGASLVRITNKRILSHTDLGTLFLQYLRNSHAEAVQARWNQDGVFDTKLGLDAPAANTVRVTGTSMATDGLGAILKPANIYPGADAVFENTVAVDYEVGLKYAELPEGVRINPRTGKPEYDHSVEHIGVSGTPNLVVDNGNGTITFRVNSVTEAGVTNAGRTVRVYKNTPAAGAVTAADAIEELTISYSGGNNEVTTVGALGQTTISTTASDYTVVLMGISVKRNTSIKSAPGYTYVGTVTGNGGTPVAFDTTDQKLFKTFQDASQIIFTPYSYLTSTDAQSAIQELVDALAAGGSATAGSTRVGFNATSFSKRFPTAVGDDIGIGNIADTTFTSTSKVQDALAQIDQVIANRRSWTLTMADGSARHRADLVDVYALQHAQNAHTKWAIGGTYFAQRGSYVCGDTGVAGFNTSINVPYMLGEESDGTPDGAVSFQLQSAADQDFYLRGKWQRFYFTSQDPSYTFVGSAGFVCEDCIAKSGDLIQDSANDTRRNAFEYRRVQFHDPSTGVDGTGFSIVGPSSGLPFGIVENCWIQGPNSGHSSPVAGLYFNGLGLAGVPVSDSYRPLTIRNCHLWQRHAGAPLLKVEGCTYPIIFHNCTFQGAGTPTDPLVSVVDGQVSFYNCRFHSTTGQALHLDGNFGVVQDCIVEGGTSTSVSNPQLVRGYGYSWKHPLVFRNLWVRVTPGAVRSTGATYPMIEIGGAEGSEQDKPTHVEGLDVQFDTATTLHSAPTLLVHGSTKGNHVRDVKVDLNGLGPGAAVTAGVLAFAPDVNSDLIVDGLSIDNIANPGSNLDTTPLVWLERAQANNFNLNGSIGGTGRWMEFIHMEDGATLIGVGFDLAADHNYGMVHLYDAHTVLRDVRVDGMDSSPSSSWLFAFNSNSSGCLIDGVHMEQVATGTVLIQCAGEYNSITNVSMVSNAILSAYLVTGPANRTRVTGNIFRGSTNTVAMIGLSGDECIVTGNIITLTAGTATISLTGSNCIGDNTNNVIQ